jgi:hypothetical protein
MVVAVEPRLAAPCRLGGASRALRSSASRCFGRLAGGDCERLVAFLDITLLADEKADLLRGQPDRIPQRQIELLDLENDLLKPGQLFGHAGL